MSNKKYRLDKKDKTRKNDRTLYRIVALRDFGDVKTGDKGGYIQKESNLSHEGNCWVYDEACVWGNAYVIDNAEVREAAAVFGEAIVCIHAKVSGYSSVYDSSVISDSAAVYDTARIYGLARVAGRARVYDSAKVFGQAQVVVDAVVCGTAVVFGAVKLTQGADVRQESHWLCLCSVGSRHDTLSVYRTVDGGVCVWTGCFRGTPEELLMRANKVHRGEKRKYYREYSAAMKLVKERAKQWKEEKRERSEIQTG